MHHPAPHPTPVPCTQPAGLAALLPGFLNACSRNRARREALALQERAAQIADALESGRLEVVAELMQHDC